MDPTDALAKAIDMPLHPQNSIDRVFRQLEYEARMNFTRALCQFHLGPESGIITKITPTEVK